MFGQLFAIALNTALESVRQPLYAALLLGGIFLLSINPAFAAFSFWDDDKLLLDLGLSTMFLSGIFLAAFTAAGVFHREIENKTALTVVSKPVPRPIFVLGKFIGVHSAVTLAFGIWGIVSMLGLRHGVMITAADEFDGPVLTFGLGALFLALIISAAANYWQGWVFNSTLAVTLFPLMLLAWVGVLSVSKKWEFQALATDFNPQLLLAMLLLLEALAIVSAFAIALSARLAQLPTLIACLVIFMAGMSSDYLFGQYAPTSYLAKLCYALVPNFQEFWVADALNQKHALTAGYAADASLYAALYLTAVLCIAVALFQTRETG